MKETILFLDDDKYEMMGLLDKLEYDGYKVTYCYDPENARDLLEQGMKPDLIISDLIMRTNPEQTSYEAYHTGVDFCKFVREELHLCCPIIVLTIVTDEEVKKSVRQYDVVVLNKPIIPLWLLARVKEELKRKKSDQ